MRRPYILIAFIFCFANMAYAQTYDSLNLLKGHKAQVYYSKGAEERAKQMATRCDKVINFYKEKIRFEPAVTLLILSPQDWPSYTKGAVYGMPHYKNDKTLVVASEDNDFWKSFIPPIAQLPKGLADQISTTYSDAKGNLTMQAFFDLLAIHELGHAFHKQAGLTMQRKWMGELFANVFLHTYIAENEPGLLPALTVFPQMVIAGGTNGLTYTALTDFEDKYNELGQNHPKNYGWYQCRLHAAAADIYNSAGTAGFEKLWNALKAQAEILDDKSLAVLLAANVHQSVADVPLKWDNR
jgi:hypothetical protein